MPYVVEPLPAELIAEMRAWISDCEWPDLSAAQIERLSVRRVVDGVRRHYEGGVSQFEADFYQYGPETYYQ